MLTDFKLKSGRKIAYREFGNPEGEAIVFYHGFPGSSVQGGFFNGSSFVKDFRVIAFDRPGFGSSEFQADRTLVDVSADVQELMSHLQVSSFHVLGVSGGAPYAMATAAFLPEEVKSLNLMCPLGPLYRPSLMMKMPFKAQVLLMMTRLLPNTTSRMMNKALAQLSSSDSSSDSESIVEKFSAELPPSDVSIMTNPAFADILSASLSHAFAQGSDGPLHELKIFTSNWKFSLGKIQVPSMILHGTEDRIVPPAIGKFLSDHIKNSEFILVPKEGHYSLPINHVDQVLKRLSVNF